MKKKVLSVLLVAACAFSMAACGSDGKSEDGGDAAEKETLVMATNAEFPPYEYREGEEIVGIDIDIANAIGEELGVEVKVEDMDFDSVIPAISSGKADFGAAGLTITEERLANVDFTDTYAHATQVIIVTEDSEIAGPDDLVGKSIGVQLGTTGDIYAGDVEDSTVERYKKGFEAVQALSQGKIDDEAFTEEDYALAVAKDNEELTKKLNEALANLKESGKLDEIIGKYISADAE